MNNPSNFNTSIVFDPLTNTYVLQDKIGSLNFGDPKLMSFLEYQKYTQNNSVKNYWHLRSQER